MQIEGRLFGEWKGLMLCTRRLLILWLLLFSGYIANCQKCADKPSPDKLGAASRYVQRRAMVLGKAEPKLISVISVNDECFWKIDYDAGKNEDVITVYLSPNGRFLSSDMYDVTIDPVEADQKRRHKITSELTEGHPPTLGLDGAPVVVVVFSDFECPYCKEQMQILEHDVIPRMGRNIKVIYREFPLTSHPWAEFAADIGVCIERQGMEKFWQYHDIVYSDQEGITRGNARSKLKRIAVGIAGISVPVLDECLNQGIGESEVKKDVAIGKNIGVRHTPTLVINGDSYSGLRNGDDLIILIGESMALNKSLQALPQ